jgi:arylsulfatase A-like enzyme
MRLLPLLLALVVPLAAQDRERPNVLLVITDDLGHGDLGVTGARDVRTPNLDALARQGVRFTDFYANAPLCTPTRAALISGRYQQRAALEEALGGASSSSAERGLAARGTSLPQLLKARGYTTGLIGKWHLGYKPEFSPQAHGFDTFWGIKSGYVDYYHHTDGAGRPDLFDGDAPVTVEGYMTDLVTERATRFVRDHRARPFFLEVAYTAPHWPYQPPGRPSRARNNARHLDARDDDPGTRADYAAMVERVDAGIGQLVRLLDSLGIARNTLVIFTNDNGGEWLSRNQPFRHRKWTLWEGGIRVPTIMRWPGRIAPRQVTAQVGITMDLSATIVAAAGARLPEQARYEGIDLLPVVTARAPVRDRALFWRTRAGGFTQEAVRDGDWKLMVDGTSAMLFNVRRDPGEVDDLAAKHPDITRRLATRIREWKQSVDAEASGK